MDRGWVIQDIERLGDNAYKLLLPSDMTVSTTFYIGDLSLQVENYFKHALDLSSNPLEEGQVNVEQSIQESYLNPKQDHGANQAKEEQGNQATSLLIHSLISCSNPEQSVVLDGMLLGVFKTSYGQVRLCQAL